MCGDAGLVSAGVCRPSADAPATVGWHDGRVRRLRLESCEFVTDRLRVGSWHSAEHHPDVGLGEVVAEMLTERATAALPEAWRGDFSVERASAWIEERDTESPTLLATERASGRPIGLVILHDAARDESAIDVRIGYLIVEAAWGRGLATELVGGLVEWARTQPCVHTLTAGVDPAQQASARVLLKNGFELIVEGEEARATYQLRVEHRNEWDGYAEDWDEDGAARAYATAAFSSLQEVLRSQGTVLAGTRVIDFGCGTGLLTEQLVAAGATVRAVDTSPAMLAVLDAKIARHGWTSVTTSAAPPAAEPAYDLIVCSSVCSFLDDYPGTVQDLVSRLRPGAMFIQWDWERTDDDPHGLSRHEISEALGRAGLEDVSVSVAFSAAVGDQTMRPLMGHGRRA